MKYYMYFLLAIVALLLVGCESGASFTVINKSNYPIYASVGNEAEVAIPSQATHTWDIDTDTQYFFGGEVRKKVKVRMKGETYLMFDEDLDAYVDSTYIYLKAGEKRPAYIWPNRAGVKIQNQSSQPMKKANIFRHDGVIESHVVTIDIWSRVKAPIARFRLPQPAIHFTISPKSRWKTAQSTITGITTTS